MKMNVEREVAALQRMTVKQLRAKFAAVFGEETQANNKAWLVSEVVTTAPVTRDSRLPLSGSSLVREYKARR
jgi:hypothetical protein